VVELIAIFIFILVSGILAGAELAVLSIRKSRLQQLADEQRHCAKALLQLRSSPGRFLATVQIGISLSRRS